jgi:uncharacterized protein YraI
MLMTKVLVAGALSLAASAASAQVLTGTLGGNAVIVAEPVAGATVLLDAPAQSSLIVNGCGADGWCKVETGSTIGWVRSDAVNLTVEGQSFVLATPPEGIAVANLEAVPVVVEEPVLAYVAANPLTSITYSGDIALGDSLPDTVVLTPVPDTELRYVYIQDAPVIVGADGRVIAIVR